MARISKKTPAPQVPTCRRDLAQISQQIRALEKRTISNVVEIGKLLEEASELCEHGEYMKWLADEFGWSHSTSLRYRAVFQLSQNRQIGDFDKWNISISALYLLARLEKNDSEYGSSEWLARAEIIEAAQRGDRVTYRMVCGIIFRQRDEETTRIRAAYEEAHPIDEVSDNEPEEIEADEAPSLVDEELPPGLHYDGIDKETYERLAEPMHFLVDVTADDIAWPAIIEDLGMVRIQNIAEMLLAVCARYREDNAETAVEIAADATRAKQWLN
jgi:hypothetical protein